VCAINFNQNDLNSFLTGSYDEYVRLWDIRKIDNRSEPIDKLNLEGGVWRVKFCPWNSKFIAAAAMRNGFHLITLENGSKLSKFKTSLPYYHYLRND